MLVLVKSGLFVPINFANSEKFAIVELGLVYAYRTTVFQLS
jgi:prefoldin subunit 5